MGKSFFIAKIVISLFVIALLIVSGFLRYRNSDDGDKINEGPPAPEIISISIDPMEPEYGQPINITVWVKGVFQMEKRITPSEEETAIYGPSIHYKSNTPHGGGGGGDSLRWIGGDNYTIILDLMRNHTIYQFYIIAGSDFYLGESGDPASARMNHATSEWFLIHQRNDTVMEEMMEIGDIDMEMDTPGKGDITISAEIFRSGKYVDIDLEYDIISGYSSRRGGSSSHTVEDGKYVWVIEADSTEDSKEEISHFEVFFVAFDENNIGYTSDFYQL